MENFNPQQYRDHLAKNLKKIHKIDPEKARELLIVEKQTEEYLNAKQIHEIKKEQNLSLYHSQKILYKNPLFQHERKDQLSEEQLKYSENIALEKRKKIFDLEFKNFFVRYMNIEEYRDFIENLSLKGEVILYGPKGFKNIPAEKFNAEDGVYETDWDTISGHADKRSKMFSEWINNLPKKEETERKESLLKLRKHIISEWENKTDHFTLRGAPLESIEPKHGYVGSEIFAEKLKVLVGSEKFVEMDNEIRNYLYNQFYKNVNTEYLQDIEVFLINKFVEKFNFKNSSEKENLESYIYDVSHEILHGKENVTLYQKLKNDSNFILDEKNMRKVLNAFIFSSDKNRSVEMGRQYHLAVLFDNSKYNLTPYEERDDIYAGKPYWAQVDLSKIQSEDIKKSVLGIFTITSDLGSILSEEVVEINKRAGDISSPVFRWGTYNQKWPKNN